VRESGHPSAFLRAQWDEQVTAQTKPLPRKSCGTLYNLSDVFDVIGQTRTKGRKAVETAWATRQAVDTMRDEVQQLADRATDLDFEAYGRLDAQERLPAARKKLEALRKTLRQQESALGVDGQTNYQHLKTSPFIQLRMNARALKIRLRDRLAAQKFEFDRIEHSFQRQQLNGTSFAYFSELE
jgi:hypothetical protein